MLHPIRCAGGPIAAVLLIAACGGETATEPAVAVGDAERPATSPAPPTAPAPSPSNDVPATTGATAPPAPAFTAPITTSSRPTTSVSDESTTSTAVAGGCRRVTDFDDDSGAWVVVNDGVMGGRSEGRTEFLASEMRFTGTIVTQGGGFTSVRLALDGDQLAGTDRIVMRVRADDRMYGLTMEDASRSGRRPVSHRADLMISAPAADDEWSTVALRYDELEPRIFGQPIDAAPFEPDRARELGIIIADGRDGEFVLIVDWIDACG